MIIDHGNIIEHDQHYADIEAIQFSNPVFAREEAFQLQPSTVTFLKFSLLFVFHIGLSVCRFVKDNVCRKVAHCFV